MIRLEYGGGQQGNLIRAYSAEAEACEDGVRIVCSLAAAQRLQRMGVSCIRLQDASGATVETVWNTDARRGGMTARNCSRCTVRELVRVPPGVYTALVTFYVKGSLGSDSVTCRTVPVTVE